MSLKGIINIDKPQNYTSFDCVAILRRAAGTKKVGHTGTLDPMATGVLACCIGPATRILEYLEEDIKEYCGTLKLGIETDTCDIWGSATALQDVQIMDGETAGSNDGQVAADDSACGTRFVTVPEIREAFAAFEGDIEQIPPQYAAIKVDGRKLYEYAREGRHVEVPARPVTIHELEILDIREDEVDFRVVCSKGTYVRSLCRDIGAKLGTCGTMAALRRTRTGMCTIADSLPIEAVKEMDAAELEKYIVPMEKALAGYPRVDLDRQRGMDFLNGKTLADVPAPYKEEGLAEGAEADSPDGSDSTGCRVRVFGDGRFLGMATYDPAERTIKPHKVLAPEIREEWLGEAANGRV